MTTTKSILPKDICDNIQVFANALQSLLKILENTKSLTAKDDKMTKENAVKLGAELIKWYDSVDSIRNNLVGAMLGNLNFNTDLFSEQRTKVFKTLTMLLDETSGWMKTVLELGEELKNWSGRFTKEHEVKVEQVRGICRILSELNIKLARIIMEMACTDPLL